MNYHGIFDTHAHYADKQFNADREQLLKEKLPSSGIQYIMLAGVELFDCYQSQELARQYDDLFCSAGIHPSHVQNLPSDWLEQIRTLTEFPKCKAIGEIGLDYYRNKAPADLQKDILIQQITLAQELNLPCVFHFRDATEDMMNILQKYQPCGILHCYNGSAETAKALLKIPELYFSFSGVITYPNARKPLDALAVIPDNRILIETDCPYLPPEPFRRQRCDSSMIIHTAEKAAEIRKISVQEFITMCCENALRIFRI